MYDMKALILCWSLLVYVGLKVASKVVKENWEQGIHGWHEGSNIYKRLVQLVMRFVWQAKVMWIRHNMLLHSLKLGWLVIWDEYCCTREASKRKVNETWVNVYMMSQIGKLAYEIKWWIYIDKEDFMHNTNQCEVQNERLGWK